MAVKWSKNICIQYSAEMRSKLEEVAKGNGNMLIERLREAARNQRADIEITASEVKELPLGGK